MGSRKPLTDQEGEVRELTARDAAEAVPFSTLPKAERRMLFSIRGDTRSDAAEIRDRKNANLQTHEGPPGHHS
jgi:hypothetical protein